MPFKRGDHVGRVDVKDPLDVLVLCTIPIESLALVRCYPIGVISMQDGGDMDYKVIAIPFNDPINNCFTDIKQLPDHLLQEIKHFFEVYKQLEGKDTVVNKIRGKALAMDTIAECIKAYNEKFPDKNYDYKVKQK